MVRRRELDMEPHSWERRQVSWNLGIAGEWWGEERAL